MIDRVQDRIRAITRKHRVVIFMKGTPTFPMCPASAASVDVFNQLGVGYEAIDVLADPELRDAVKRSSGHSPLPQIYVDGELIGGGDIARELHERGDLEPLLRRRSPESERLNGNA